MDEIKKIFKNMHKTQANVFTKGLSMDTNPVNTLNNTLTDCLNGTLLTNNDNENILQNDRGNRALENSELPEGYVPVGMKSYNGVLYIVSYNPETECTEIGTYPSPMKSQGSNVTEYKNIYETLNEFEVFFPKDFDQQLTYYWTRSDQTVCIEDEYKYNYPELHKFDILEHYALDVHGYKEKINLIGDGEIHNFPNKYDAFIGYSHRVPFFDDIRVTNLKDQINNELSIQFTIDVTDDALKNIIDDGGILKIRAKYYFTTAKDKHDLFDLVKKSKSNNLAPKRTQAYWKENSSIFEVNHSNKYNEKILYNSAKIKFNDSRDANKEDFAPRLDFFEDIAKEGNIEYDKTLKKVWINGEEVLNFRIEYTPILEYKDDWLIWEKESPKIIEWNISSVLVEKEWFDIFKYKKNGNKLDITALLNVNAAYPTLKTNITVDSSIDVTYTWYQVLPDGSLKEVLKNDLVAVTPPFILKGENELVKKPLKWSTTSISIAETKRSNKTIHWLKSEDDSGEITINLPDWVKPSNLPQSTNNQPPTIANTDYSIIDIPDDLKKDMEDNIMIVDDDNTLYIEFKNSVDFDSLKKDNIYILSLNWTIEDGNNPSYTDRFVEIQTETETETTKILNNTWTSKEVSIVNKHKIRTIYDNSGLSRTSDVASFVVITTDEMLDLGEDDSILRMDKILMSKWFDNTWFDTKWTCAETTSNVTSNSSQFAENNVPIDLSTSIDEFCLKYKRHIPKYENSFIRNELPGYYFGNNINLDYQIKKQDDDAEDNNSVYNCKNLDYKILDGILNLVMNGENTSINFQYNANVNNSNKIKPNHIISLNNGSSVYLDYDTEKTLGMNDELYVNTERKYLLEWMNFSKPENYLYINVNREQHEPIDKEKEFTSIRMYDTGINITPLDAGWVIAPNSIQYDEKFNKLKNYHTLLSSKHLWSKLHSKPFKNGKCKPGAFNAFDSFVYLGSPYLTGYWSKLPVNVSSDADKSGNKLVVSGMLGSDSFEDSISLSVLNSTCSNNKSPLFTLSKLSGRNHVAYSNAETDEWKYRILSRCLIHDNNEPKYNVVKDGKSYPGYSLIGFPIEEVDKDKFILYMRFLATHAYVLSPVDPIESVEFYFSDVKENNNEISYINRILGQFAIFPKHIYVYSKTPEYLNVQSWENLTSWTSLLESKEYDIKKEIYNSNTSIEKLNYNNYLKELRTSLNTMFIPKDELECNDPLIDRPVKYDVNNKFEAFYDNVGTIKLGNFTELESPFRFDLINDCIFIKTDINLTNVEGFHYDQPCNDDLVVWNVTQPWVIDKEYDLSNSTSYLSKAFRTLYE